ncbi:MAG TPA: hypothetical protein VGE52_07380, partial [Pirellulales bacterium]
LAAARDHGAQAFLTLRAFGLAAGRKGDLELAREAAAAFQDASPLAPPELRLPIDVVRVDLVRELQRLCKRLDKAAETQSTHPAAVKATLQLAETLRVYGLYDDARKALSDGAFYDSLRNLSEMDSNTKALRDLALDARRDVGKWAELRAHVQQAIETNSADDAAARTALGRVFIGSLANFDLAAPLLAEGNDPILTPLAKKYLECRTSPAAYLDLAKGCHTAAPPGSPESVQAVFATLGAEAAARYLDSGLTADAETQALARVLRDRAESLRPKFFPAEALSPPGDSRPPADLRDAVSLTGAELLLTSTPSGSPPPMPRSGRPR